jgi:hypothetical protein
MEKVDKLILTENLALVYMRVAFMDLNPWFRKNKFFV